MKKWLRNRKAVSPVIAALLLIAISVAAAVITYSWVMSMIDSQGKQAQTQIRIEDVQFDVTPIPLETPVPATDQSELIITLRNGGGVVAVIETFYIYDGDTRIVKVDDIAFALPVGDLAEIGFTDAATWQSAGTLKAGTILNAPTELRINVKFFEDLADLDTSHAYMIKLVTDNGFTIEGTYYTPSAW